jgi:hypothetical protein
MCFRPIGLLSYQVCYRGPECRPKARAEEIQHERHQYTGASLIKLALVIINILRPYF